MSPIQKPPLNFIQPRETGRIVKARDGRARRLVLGLRLALPVVAGVLLLSLVLWPFFNKQLVGFLVKKAIPDLVVENLHFTSFDSKRQPYTITASKATRVPSQPDVYNLEKPAGDIALVDGRKLHAEALQGVYDQDARTLHMTGAVRVASSDDRTFESEEAFVQLDEGAAEGHLPVTLHGAFGIIKGTGFQLFDQGKRVIIKPPAHAVLNMKAKDEKPQETEISANDSLEWQEDQKLYTARGDARAAQNGATVQADTLTAHQAENTHKTPAPTEATGTLDHITAVGHVQISDPRQHITGDHATYDAAKGQTRVTGKKLAYASNKVTVTARDSLEYRDDSKTAIARGHAVAKDKEGRHLEADILTAQFDGALDGQNSLKTVLAEGHVRVTTKEDVSSGDHAVYDVANDHAILTGHVRIHRADGTELSGEKAMIDFKTNRSQLMNETSGGRVKALFEPDDKK